MQPIAKTMLSAFAEHTKQSLREFWQTPPEYLPSINRMGGLHGNINMINIG
jgi:hypothetical protein